MSRFSIGSDNRKLQKDGTRSEARNLVEGGLGFRIWGLGFEVILRLAFPNEGSEAVSHASVETARPNRNHKFWCCCLGILKSISHEVGIKGPSSGQHTGFGVGKLLNPES